MNIKELLEELNTASSTYNQSPPDEWDRRFTVFDDTVLLSFGFKYGFSNETMWGYDKEGREWCVWFTEDAGAGGAEWYLVLPSGVKRRYGAMRFSEVHELFNKQSRTSVLPGKSKAGNSRVPR